MESPGKEETIRLDKWLSLACIIKTRSQATKVCDDSRIKVNDQPAKPSRLIKAGDKITIKEKTHSRRLDVLEIVHKSVSHQRARELYFEHDLTPEEKETISLQKALYQAGAHFRPKFKGRPTKRERRRLEDFRGRSQN
jgi:ribosome-associated heat shock protein Hsp15